MSCRSEPVAALAFAAVRTPHGGLLAALAVAAMVAAAGGCQTANYKATRLPEPLRATAAQPNSSINLARIAGRGSNSSHIGPGDLLNVTIASGASDEKPEPVQARVAQNGTVLVPLIGPVDVAGLEPVQAEQRVAAAAVERGIYRHPYVTLSVTAQAVNRVTVLGAVAEPGVHELPRGSSDLVTALGAAGGLSEEAGTEVEILHQGTPSYLADDTSHTRPQPSGQIALASYEQPADSPINPLGLAPPPLTGQASDRQAPKLLPQPAAGSQTVRIDLAQAGPGDDPNRDLADGDVVMVLPKKERFIHVSGLVRKPDQFEIPRDQNVHVLDAIALAGGMSSPVADKVLVIRQMDGMPQPAVIEVSVARAKRNGDENLLLAPGDLVTVETTVVTTVVDTARDLFRVTAGLGTNLVTF